MFKYLAATLSKDVSCSVHPVCYPVQAVKSLLFPVMLCGSDTYTFHAHFFFQWRIKLCTQLLWTLFPMFGVQSNNYLLFPLPTTPSLQQIFFRSDSQVRWLRTSPKVNWWLLPSRSQSSIARATAG